MESDSTRPETFITVKAVIAVSFRRFTDEDGIETEAPRLRIHFTCMTKPSHSLIFVYINIEVLLCQYIFLIKRLSIRHQGASERPMVAVFRRD